MIHRLCTLRPKKREVCVYLLSGNLRNGRVFLEILQTAGPHPRYSRLSFFFLFFPFFCNYPVKKGKNAWHCELTSFWYYKRSGSIHHPDRKKKKMAPPYGVFLVSFFSCQGDRMHWSPTVPPPKSLKFLVVGVRLPAIRMHRRR